MEKLKYWDKSSKRDKSWKFEISQNIKKSHNFVIKSQNIETIIHHSEKKITFWDNKFKFWVIKN